MPGACGWLVAGLVVGLGGLEAVVGLVAGQWWLKLGLESGGGILKQV